MAQELAVLALLAAAAAASPFPQLVPFANSTAVENPPLCVPQFVTVPAVTVTETLPASTFIEEHYMTTLTERSGPSVVTASASASTVTTTLTDTTTVSDTTTFTQAAVKLAQVTETTTTTAETTSTKTVEETTTQTASHKVPPKIVTLPASSIYKTITKTQAPETVTRLSTTTKVSSKLVFRTVTDLVAPSGSNYPSQVTVQFTPIATSGPGIPVAPSKESVQKLYELMRESRSFADFFRSLPEDLKELARANPALVDELYGYFRWYEKSHEEIKGFAPKVAEDVDRDCSTKDTDTDYNKGFSAIIAEAPKYDGCKAKIEKAKSEVSPAFRVEEDCSSVPDELRTGCPATCGFYQATRG